MKVYLISDTIGEVYLGTVEEIYERGMSGSAGGPGLSLSAALSDIVSDLLENPTEDVMLFAIEIR